MTGQAIPPEARDHVTSAPQPGYRLHHGPAHLALADWRRRINALYCDVRRIGASRESRQHWHQTRSEMFRHHPASPLPSAARAGAPDIAVYDYDPALRFEVGTLPVAPDTQDVDLGADGVMIRQALARTDGLAQRLGAELTLFWIGGYGGGLFLPYADVTSGDETYGGGRYLLDAIKGADLGEADSGRLVLDFNFAYHPSCALNAAWVCPLAPSENTLPVAIRAGERLI